MENRDISEQLVTRFKYLINKATSLFKCDTCLSTWNPDADRSIFQKAIKYLQSGDIVNLEEEIIPEFYEIIIGMILRRLGYEVIHYEHIKRNKKNGEKTPDFLIRDISDNEFFVEVTCAISINSLDRNVQQLMNILHCIASDMGEGLVFSISIDYVPEEETTKILQKEEKIDKRIRDIIQDIVTNQASQNKFRQFAKELFEKTINEGEVSKEWKHPKNKGRLKFSSRLISNSFSSKLKSLVMLSYVGPSYSYLKKAIENKIKGKKKYEELNKPVVLFIGVPFNMIHSELHNILAHLVYGISHIDSLKDIMEKIKAQQCKVVFTNEKSYTLPLKGNEYLIHLSDSQLQYEFAGYIIHYFSPVEFLLNPEMSGSFVSILNPFYEKEYPPVLFDFPICLFSLDGFKTIKNSSKLKIIRDCLKISADCQ